MSMWRAQDHAGIAGAGAVVSDHLHLYTEAHFRRLMPNTRFTVVGEFWMYGQKVRRLRCGVIDYIVLVDDQESPD